MKSFGWAIVGPGRIAHRFAEAVTKLDGTHIEAIHGRDVDRAAAFARAWPQAGHDGPRWVAKLDDMLADKAIDAVYIATPHPFHFDAAQRCLDAGMPVLCEKPLVPNLQQAEQLVALSRARGVFLMEAVWTRYLPIYEVIGGWLKSGAIGSVRSMQSRFCFNAPFDPTSRVYDPALAGGALLDIGIYNINVTRWVMAMVQGHCPPLTKMEVEAVLAPTGVDQRIEATLYFANGVTSAFVCDVTTKADNAFQIVGDQGSITIAAGFSMATRATLQRNGEAPIAVQRDHAINGFEGEIVEAIRCVRSGLIESPAMSHAESLATVALMDEIRRRIGVRYPFEA